MQWDIITNTLINNFISIHHEIAETVTNTVDPMFFKEQFELFTDAYTKLEITSTNYINLLRSITYIFVSAFTIIIGRSIYEFYTTMKGVKNNVEEIIQKRVSEEVSLIIETQVTPLKRMIERENIFTRTELNYIIPASQGFVRTKDIDFAVGIFKKHGVQVNIQYIPELQKDKTPQKFVGNVTVLDLFNLDISEKDTEDIIQRMNASIPKHKGILVVHFAGYSESIKKISQDGHYCSAANNTLSLVSRVLEAAYIADAMKEIS